MTTESQQQLVKTAESHANAGRWGEAEKSWQALYRIAPENPKACYGLGFHALQRGDASAARKYLEQATALAPKDLLAWLTLATACGQLADAQSELQALESALIVEPYCLPALLLKAVWMERNARPQEAVVHYRNALKIAPPRGQWPPSLAPQLTHAAQVVEQHRERYSRYLGEQLAGLQAGLAPSQQGQWREALDIFGGRTLPYTSQCNQLQVPRLPAIPFFDRNQFPWLAPLEQKTAAITAELQGLLAAADADFTPYIAYQPGQPVNQWAELNHSAKWSALHLWRGGVPVAENLARCPVTAGILQSLPMADIAGLCPNVMFSALAPGTHIPPHHGETNARLVAHLPLIVPEGCGLRVGHEQRSWTVGETLIFDDSIEHEAYNSSNELRVVLIFDLWNPLLSQPERQMVQGMVAAAREFAG